VSVALESAKSSAATAADAVSANGEAPPSFIKRHGIALGLGVIALCIYAGSILWFIVNRGV